MRARHISSQVGCVCGLAKSSSQSGGAHLKLLAKCSLRGCELTQAPRKPGPHAVKQESILPNSRLVRSIEEVESAPGVSSCTYLVWCLACTMDRIVAGLTKLSLG